MKGAQPVPKPAGRDDVALYELRVWGLLGESWPDWLDGLTIEPQTCGETQLTGPIRDQAGLHGLLNKIRDLGLPWLCVKLGRSPERVK